MSEVFYRYREVLYSPGFNEDGDRIDGTGRIAIVLDEHQVIKRTPCGAWIDVDFTKRFVNLSWGKRYAVPTIEEARESFIARKKREITIMDARSKTARRALETAMRQWESAGR